MAAFERIPGGAPPWQATRFFLAFRPSGKENPQNGKRKRLQATSADRAPAAHPAVRPPEGTRLDEVAALIDQMRALEPYVTVAGPAPEAAIRHFGGLCQPILQALTKPPETAHKQAETEVVSGPLSAKRRV
jgi:hypothetical protein